MPQTFLQQQQQAMFGAYPALQTANPLDVVSAYNKHPENYNFDIQTYTSLHPETWAQGGMDPTAAYDSQAIGNSLARQNDPKANMRGGLVVGGGGGGGGTAPSSVGGLTAFPGYAAIMQDLAGVISPDVKQQIYQSAAERGIATGTGGSQSNDAAMMRAIGLTSDQLRSRGVSEMSPLWQQQVSEAGQTSRLGMSLAAQMEQLQYSENMQSARQGAQLAAQSAIAQMQEAGLNSRYAQGLAAELQRLSISEAGADRRQAMELAGAMDRLKVGNASQADLARLSAATSLAIAGMNNLSSLQRQQLQIAAEKEMQAANNSAQMQRLTYSTSNVPAATSAQIASQEKISNEELALRKAIADMQDKLGYYSINHRGYDYSSPTSGSYRGGSQGGQYQNGGRVEFPASAGGSTGSGLAPFDYFTSNYGNSGGAWGAGQYTPTWMSGNGYLPTSGGTMYMGSASGGPSQDELDFLYALSSGTGPYTGQNPQPQPPPEEDWWNYYNFTGEA